MSIKMKSRRAQRHNLRRAIRNAVESGETLFADYAFARCKSASAESTRLVRHAMLTLARIDFSNL